MLFRVPSILVLAAALALPILSGCAPEVGGNTYSSYEARQSMTTYNASVVSVREVTIAGRTSDNQVAGGIIGAVAGGVIGSTIGHGAGRDLATLGGALLGGAAGAGVGTAASRRTGLQITVQYENGAQETVIQGTEPPIYAGQQVLVLVSQDGTRRIQPR